jgi:hypothetical protein
MKEVVLKEFRGGSQGVSFRVTKGVRYPVGGFKGHAVVVGKELQVQDVGSLSVTSSRVVYLGEKKTTEFLYSKLVGCEVFDDRLRLQVSNRQTASLFKVIPAGAMSWPPRSTPRCRPRCSPFQAASSSASAGSASRGTNEERAATQRRPPAIRSAAP